MATKLSKLFLSELKLHPIPAYQLAIAAGLNPSSLSMLMHGGQKVDREDERLVALGKMLGLEEQEVFEEGEPESWDSSESKGALAEPRTREKRRAHPKHE